MCRTTAGKHVVTGASGVDDETPPYSRLQHRRATFDTVVTLRVESVSLSTISRIEGVAWNTVARWLDRAASVCRRFSHGRIAGFAVEELQVDEIRSFTGGKSRPTWIFASIEGLVASLAVDRCRATQLPQHVGARSRRLDAHGVRDMILQEGPPGRDGRGRRRTSVVPDGGFGDLDAEFQ